MHMTLPRESLQQALQTVLLPDNPLVRLEATPAGLRLLTANGIYTASTIVAGTCIHAGRVHVCHALLARSIAALHAATVKLRHETEHHCLRVDAASGTTLRLPEVEVTVDDTPRSASTPSRSIDLDGAALRQAIGQVSFAAAAGDDGRGLSGIHLTIAAERLRLVALDGFRLAQTELGIGGSGRLELLLPAVALRHLARMIDRSRPVRLLVEGAGGHVRLEAGNASITTGCLKQPFPDVAGILAQIPQTPVRVNVPLDALREAVQLAVLSGTDPDVRPVRVRMAPGRLCLEAGGPSGIRVTSTIATTGAGAPLVLFLNSLPLQEILAAAAGPHLEVSGSGPANPVILRESAGQTFWIAMPVRDPGATGEAGPPPPACS